VSATAPARDRGAELAQQLLDGITRSVPAEQGAQLRTFADRGELPADHAAAEQVLYLAANVAVLTARRTGADIHVRYAARRARLWIEKQQRVGFREASLAALIAAVVGRSCETPHSRAMAPR
jgi:hypothetical protein